jgi:SNF2 family DNA or RNA helicase
MLRRMEGTELPSLRFETVVVEQSDELLKSFLREETAAVAVGDEELRRALAKPDDSTLKVLEATAASYSTLRRFTVLAKLPAIAEILEQNFEAGMDKMVLFAVHVQAVEWLAEKLKRFNPVTLYGKTPANKKQTVVDAFQNNEDCHLLIGNIQTAGVAITLTAGCEVGFAEKNWVPGDIVQALKRCHRRGQTRPVRVRSFTLYDSSDEAVDEALMRKVKELAKIL